ncbi:phage minor capsid protein [Listeria cornellensis]|uniref:Protein gp4 n=1 Tax=Listeria cornellensis FSL F6-0969 TaxID=1265820 RepID=W7BJT2_9LIST|nr:phage minor capsid protein [Listeria cornellensis]EUJ27329.1 protein gp4 [Listeria cornellensis FSL F6-0969]
MQLSQQIIEIYLKLEGLLLDSIGKAIGSGSSVPKETLAKWQAGRYKELSRLQNYQLQLIMQAAKKINPKMRSMIRETAAVEARITTKEIKQVLPELEGIPFADSPNTRQALMTLDLEAMTRLEMMNATMLKQSSSIYLEIITQASAEFVNGTITLEEALVKTATKWSENGIPALIDRRGAKWSTEAYINMVVKNTQKKRC